MKVAIYKIIHQDTGAVYYIGQTIMPDVRLCAHLCSGAGWVAVAQEKGHTLSMEIIEWVDELIATSKEVFWIQHYKSLGANLGNKQFMKLGERYKVFKIDASLHHRLHIAAAQEGKSIQSLAESFITTGLASLLKRKQSATGNPLRIRKGEKV